MATPERTIKEINDIWLSNDPGCLIHAFTLLKIKCEDLEIENKELKQANGATSKPLKNAFLYRVRQRFSDFIKSMKPCKHEYYDCDTQIRVIKCRQCGKQAWIKEYRNLF